MTIRSLAAGLLFAIVMFALCPRLDAQGPGTVNYLAPFDPSLRPGYLRLDGLLIGSIANGDGQMQMRVLWVTMPGERRTVFAAPRTKRILFDTSTLFTWHHRRLALTPDIQSATQPMHVTAIGADARSGSPLRAGSIDIEPATPLETALCDDMQNRAATIGSRRVSTPIVSLEETRITVAGTPRMVQFVRALSGTFRIGVGLADGKVGDTESLSAIAKRYGAIAAINGSFFECYTDGPIKMPDHALITRGRLVSRGGVGTMIGQTPDGEIRFDPAYFASRWHEYDPTRPPAQILTDPQESVLFWVRATEALGCGPRLVTNGAISLSPDQEGFSSSEVLSGVSVRSAVGVTSDGSLILISTHASLAQLADIMAQLGCRDAINLDGGASSGLWLRGRTIRTPGRLLSNALLILPR